MVGWRSRGSALISVLMLSCLILLVLLAFASSSITNLNLTQRHLDTVRSDGLARAAVEEFLLQLGEVRQAADVTQVPPSIFSSFQHGHLLLKPDSRLACEARLLTQGRYRSVDNSLSSVPAQSCFDGDNQASVPPFSVSLVFELRADRKTTYYEAFLQQVWPYALTAPGPIRILGQEPGIELEVADGLGGVRGARRRELGDWKGTSVIEGHVLATRAPISPPPPSGTPDQPVALSNTFYRRLYAFSKGSPRLGSVNALPSTRVQVGGDYSVWNYRPHTQIQTGDEGVTTTSTRWDAVEQKIHTIDALIHGRIDLYENSDPEPGSEPAPDNEVWVAPDSRHDGPVRQNFRWPGLDPGSPESQRLLARMFKAPDTSQWTRINNDQLALLDGETTLSSRSRSGGRVITVPSGQVVYDGSIRLGTSSSEMPSLVLEDMALAVKGNVVLGPAPESADGQDRPTLRGSNATLIVEGSLIVDSGELDAGGNGMVIFCRDFIMKAQGHYNGLIIAQRGGAFVGSSPGVQADVQDGDGASELLIRGGVIVGGNRLTVEGIPTLEFPQELFPPVRLASLAMISTRIEYDPKYLRTLNQFGHYQLVGLERRN